MTAHSRGGFLLAIVKTGGGTAVNMVFSILTTKILALVLGPAGLGFWALIKQTNQSLVRLGALGGQVTVAQALASRDGKARDHYVASATILFLSGTVLISLVLTFFAAPLASLMLDRTDGAAVRMIRWLIISVGIGVAQIFLYGIFNGNRAIGRLAMAGILTAGVNLALAWFVAPLVAEGHAEALIILLSAGQFLSLCWCIWIAVRNRWLSSMFSWPGFSQFRSDATHFMRMSGALLTAGLSLTVGMLAVRVVVLHTRGTGDVGLFDAAWTISATYVMLALSSFATYFVPTMAASQDASDRARQIDDAIRLVIGLILPLLIILLCFRDFVIGVLYSKEFLEASRLLRWTLVGDCIRLICWCLSGPMIASAHAGRLTLIELFVTGLLVSGGGCLAIWLYGDFEIFGPVYVVSMAVYAVIAGLYSRKFHEWNPVSAAFGGWCLAFALVVGTAFLAWHSPPSVLGAAAVIAASLCLAAWLNMDVLIHALKAVRRAVM